MAGGDIGPSGVLAFWFEEAGPSKWFARDEAFDRLIERRFGELWRRAAAGALADWEATAEGALALAILLDQFPRNLFRGTAAAFADDAKALAVAERALRRGVDRALPPARRRFLYMPYMHSEDSAAQERSVALFEALAAEAPAFAGVVGYAVRHRDIVRRFGRFPHRNAALGRTNTPEEATFLMEPGSSF